MAKMNSPRNGTYNQEEIFNIIRSCDTGKELLNVGRAFGYLTRNYSQHSLLLISKLYRIKEKQLSDGSAAK